MSSTQRQNAPWTNGKCREPCIHSRNKYLSDERQVPPRGLALVQLRALIQNWQENACAPPEYGQVIKSRGSRQGRDLKAGRE